MPLEFLAYLRTLVVVFAAVSAQRQVDVEEAAADAKVLASAGVGSHGQDLLDFFRRRTPGEADLARLLESIRQLGSTNYRHRAAASQALVEAGPPALPLLREALKGSALEVSRRAELCIAQIERGLGSALPGAAARQMVRQKPAGAIGCLLQYLPHADDDTVEGEVFSALLALGSRSGKVDSALSAALRDPVAVRRAAAAFVLGRHTDLGTRAAAAKLLGDTDHKVRLRAAQGLLAGNERAAVRALVDLLKDAPPDLTTQAEEMLLGLAGETAPEYAPGRSDRTSDADRHANWVAWSREYGDRLDLARLAASPRSLGRTLVIEFNTNRVAEYDRAGKLLWQINANGPMDAQVLPGGRILVAESGAQRVTERDTKGKITWTHSTDGEPVYCQRLPNGNTFIGLRAGALEINRAGKVVFSHAYPNGYLHSIHRMRNGHVLTLSGSGNVMETNGNGRTVRTLTLDLKAAGEMIDLPGGRFLVSHYGAGGGVFEIDASGKRLWEKSNLFACGVERLPNGRTLVGSDRRVLEIDRAGRVVWEIAVQGSARRVHRR
jgi:HEAT repeat protein